MNLKNVLAGSTFAAGLAICAAVVDHAQAGVVFQSIPSLAADPVSNAWCSSCGGYYKVYDAFTLSSPANLTGLLFDVQTAGATDVDVSIYTGTPSSPGSVLYDNTFAPSSFTSVTNTPYVTSIIGVALPGISLAAGSYVISFYNPSQLGIPGYSGGSGLLYQAGIGPHAGESAGFALSSVPEPSIWALMLTGFAGLGAAIRARRKQVTA
ncbi:MAG: PEP-CTERM sorting domain-containing protein [Caulobacteraceae bacterium]